MSIAVVTRPSALLVEVDGEEGHRPSPQLQPLVPLPPPHMISEGVSGLLTVTRLALVKALGCVYSYPCSCAGHMLQDRLSLVCQPLMIASVGEGFLVSPFSPPSFF